MKELKGTKTEQNLRDAFAGESQACTKYSYYASKAKKDGYEQIAALFEETAGNEKEHAKLWFKYLHGGEIPDTVTNLKDAAAGENYEWTDMYDRMAREAEEEGLKLVENIEKGLVFSREGDRIWKCRNCGHLVIGKNAPKICPVCAHPQSYFELSADNY